MSLTRFAGAGALALGISLASPPAHAQIFTDCINCVDIPTSWLQTGAELAQAVKEYTLDLQIWVGDNLSWAKQAAQYALQIQQYAEEVQMFINWVHDPTLGGALGLLAVAGLGSGLPVNPIALLGVVNGIDAIAHDSSGRFVFGQLAGVLGSLSAFANVAYAKNHVYTPVDGSWDSLQLNGGAASIAGTQGIAMQATNDLQTHLLAQPALREHLLGASSPKDVQDAQAEVELESAWELNEIGQMLSGQLTYVAQHDSREQRDDENFVASIDKWLAASGTGLN